MTQKHKISQGDLAVKSDDVVFCRKICLHISQHMTEGLLQCTWSQSYSQCLLVSSRQYLHAKRQGWTDASHSSAYCSHTGNHLWANRGGVRDIVHILNDHAILKQRFTSNGLATSYLEWKMCHTGTYNPCIPVDCCLRACLFNDLGHFHTTQGGAWDKKKEATSQLNYSFQMLSGAV